MPDWISENTGLLWWIGVATAVVTAVAIPLVIARLPADYLSRENDDRDPPAARNPLLRIGGLILKNLLGWLLILAGIAMLIAPGQGVLAIFVGLTLISFPGKHRLLRALLARPSIHRAANWIRERCGQQPLRLPA